MNRRHLLDIAAAGLLALGTSALVDAQDAAQRGSALLGRLRQALGGEAKLAEVKGLTFEADMRRVLPGEAGEPGPEMSGQVQFDIAGPQRFLSIDSFSPMAGMPPISIGSAIDGDTQWTGPVSAPGGPNIMIRSGAGGDPAQLRRRLERDASRIYIALLAGQGLPGFEYSYGGSAESPDGKAEVLIVKGPGGFDGKLLLDEKTSRPLMLVYRDAPRRMQMRRGTPQAGAASAGAHDAPTPPSAPEMKEAQMFFSDYKAEGGVSFPRSVVIKVQDGPAEEWTVSRVKVNPTFGADHFKKR